MCKCILKEHPYLYTFILLCAYCKEGWKISGMGNFALTIWNSTCNPIFASQGLRFGSPFSPPMADLEYILKFVRNATWWFIEVAPLR